MDHKEAVQLQAAAKYVLGELPPDLRDAYEEHFFDCAECALDMQATAAFAENARNVLGQEARDVNLRAAASAGGRWLAWLKPMVAVPALAVLLLALGYQSFVSVPHWKTLATQATASRVLPMYSLISANTRGSDSLTFRVPPGERFGLYVEVPADVTYRTYFLRSLSYEEAQKTQVVEVNPGNRSGAYQLVVAGLTSPESDPVKATNLATMKFSVEFTK